MNSSSLPHFLAEHISSKLRPLPSDIRADIYALSLYFDTQNAELVFSVNTNAQVQRAMLGKSNAFGMPSSESEARWNYAFWMQEPSSRFLTPPDSPDGILWSELLQEQNIIYSDQDSFDVDTYEEQLSALLIDIAQRTAKILHSSGVIEDLFGNPIPIIIHELEYYEEISEVTASANPPGLTDAFSSWVAEA